jgi:hypothetical protein
MFTKRNSRIKQRSQNLYLLLYLGKKKLCSTKGNTKFVTNDFIKDMKPTITIIGAGISGLSVGLHLHRQGFL